MLGTRKRPTTAEGAPNGDARKGRGSTAIYEEMREDILSLRMAPGSALDEVALAARFGMSRTPIREALLMLSREDLVTFLPGRSAIVRPHTMSNAHEYMDAIMLLARAIQRLAAEARTPGALAKIEATRDAYRAAVETGTVDEIMATDLAFHRTISFASGNEFLGNFYRMALDSGRRMKLLHYYPLFDPAERQRSIEQHAAIVDAIESGDAAACDRLASDHLMSELRVVQRSLEPKVGSRLSVNRDSGE